MTNSIVLDKPAQIDMFRILTLRSAIRLYVRSGIKANRMYTPSNMVATASALTGKTFKGNSPAKLRAAFAALTELVGDEKTID